MTTVWECTPYNHIVAVAQGRDAIEANLIIGVAADEAIRCGDDAADSRAATAPRHGPTTAVPVKASDYVVAIPQLADAGAANRIIGVTADETICCGDGAADARAAVA